jgi:LPXTG-site transpeptidase (sortase) family protein
VLIFVVIPIILLITSFSAQTVPDLYGAVERNWITPYPENPGAKFGNAIAYSRDTIVVGSRSDSITVGTSKLYGVGSAYVYVRDGDNWVQQAKLTPESPQAGENFGGSVAIDKDTIAVGASGRNSEDKINIGAVYIFTRTGDEWTEQARIEPQDGAEQDYFGNSVAISADRLVVGADGKDIGDLEDAGSVYSFYRSQGQWKETQSFASPAPFFEGAFGYALALDGARLVVGAPGEKGSGAAYLFYRNGGTWVAESKIDPDDDKSGDRFGNSVALSGGTVIVGAPFANPDTGNGPLTDAGAAYVFKQKGNKWQQSAKIMDENGHNFDSFGISVALDQKMAVVGATGYDHFGKSNVGAAFLFKLAKGKWVYQTRVLPSQADQQGVYGTSVVLNNFRMMVGQPGPVYQAGTSYIYSIQAGMLPDTGFAPDQRLVQPVYQGQNTLQTETLWLEIPALSLQVGILGVPREGNGWDLSWLGDTVGHLQGTAYPLWLGNTVISGHVTLPGGNPGPFSEIQKLKQGDILIIHSSGITYIYEVQHVYQTSPSNLNVLKRSYDHDWLTLITCSRYDSQEKTYQSRTIVVAVRVE